MVNSQNLIKVDSLPDVMWEFTYLEACLVDTGQPYNKYLQFHSKKKEELGIKKHAK